MPVPFIDLKRALQPIRTKILKDWEKCFDETQFVGGAFVKELETKLQTTLKAPYAVSCANGTDAIILALQACGVRKGMRVAMPNLTFWATYEAIVQIGAVPVLVDIDANDLQMSFSEFTQAHDTYQLDAAILVHLMGWCSGELNTFRTYCKDRNIKLIEDGAQSFGVTFQNESVYKNALAATLSFYPAKVLGGAMDGGAVTSTSASIANEIRTLANHGRSNHYSYSHVGWNSRMGGLQASFLNHCLDIADTMLASRQSAEQKYRSLIKDVLGERVKMYGPPEGSSSNGYLIVLESEIASGESISNALREVGIGSANTYPQTIDFQPPAADSLKIGELQNSKRFCKAVFNLPIFAGITDQEVEQSVTALKNVLSKF